MESGFSPSSSEEEYTSYPRLYPLRAPPSNLLSSAIDTQTSENPEVPENHPLNGDRVSVRMGGDSPNVGAFMGGDGFNSPRSQPARHSMQVASAVFSGTGTPFERTDINCLVATIQDVDRAGAMARQVFAAVCMQRALEVREAVADEHVMIAETDGASPFQALFKLSLFHHPTKGSLAVLKYARSRRPKGAPFPCNRIPCSLRNCRAQERLCQYWWACGRHWQTGFEAYYEGFFQLFATTLLQSGVCRVPADLSPVRLDAVCLPLNCCHSCSVKVSQRIIYYTDVPTEAMADDAQMLQIEVRSSRRVKLTARFGQPPSRWNPFSGDASGVAGRSSLPTTPVQSASQPEISRAHSFSGISDSLSQSKEDGPVPRTSSMRNMPSYNRSRSEFNNDAPVQRILLHKSSTNPLLVPGRWFFSVDSGLRPSLSLLLGTTYTISVSLVSVNDATAERDTNMWDSAAEEPESSEEVPVHGEENGDWVMVGDDITTPSGRKGKPQIFPGRPLPLPRNRFSAMNLSGLVPQQDEPTDSIERAKTPGGDEDGLNESRLECSSSSCPGGSQRASIVIPSYYVCPITRQLMQEPAVAADGHSYEMAAIERWLTDHNRSPLTGAVLPHKFLMLNFNLKAQIQAWLMENGGENLIASQL